MVEKHLIKKYYDFLGNNRIRCELCPNMCIIAEDKAGLCTTRVNIKGKLYSTIYGYPCSIHIDPIEKKPLYHYYPGEGILSIGTFGCNLFCKGCQNFDISRADASKIIVDLKYYTPEEIVETAFKNNVKLIAYTYNEPTIFFEYMLDIAKLAKKKGIKNVIVSNGYINPSPLKELCKYIDAANIDIKGITEKFYRQYSRVDIKPILKTIKILHKKGIWIELTNLIIPELNDNPKDITKLCEWIKDNVGTNVPLHFSKFYPYYQASHILQTSPTILEKAKEIASSVGIKYVYVGNLGFLDNTTCPKCKKTIISRSHISVNATGLSGKHKNECSNCRTIIPGIFN
jgi:pyruvate formate lyase activating enzyme